MVLLEGYGAVAAGSSWSGAPVHYNECRLDDFKELSAVAAGAIGHLGQCPTCKSQRKVKKNHIAMKKLSRNR